MRLRVAELASIFHSYFSEVDRGRHLSPSLRLIRLIKTTVSVAVAGTIIELILIAGWQTRAFLADRHWSTLAISSILRGTNGSEMYSTAAFNKIGSNDPSNLADALLQVPLFVPLLLGAILLIAFYSWLSKTETRYSKRSHSD